MGFGKQCEKQPHFAILSSCSCGTFETTRYSGVRIKGNLKWKSLKNKPVKNKGPCPDVGRSPPSSNTFSLQTSEGHNFWSNHRICNYNIILRKLSMKRFSVANWLPFKVVSEVEFHHFMGQISFSVNLTINCKWWKKFSLQGPMTFR